MRGGQLGEGALGVALVLGGLPDADAGLEVDGHRHHDALGEGGAVARGDREAVLGVEAVIEGPTEGHWRSRS